MQRISWRRAAAFSGLVLAWLATSGCTSHLSERGLKSKSDPTSEKPVAGSLKVVVDSAALALGQPEQDAEQRRKFLDRFARKLTEQRFAAARQLVELHPDLALDILRDAAAGELDDRQLLALAEFHDDQMGVSGTPGSWRSCLAARPNLGAAWTSYTKLRADLLMHIRNGEFPAASKVNLPRSAAACNQPLLALEAAQLQGTALMLANQPAEAAVALNQAAQMAASLSQQQTANILLLVSESRRRANDNAGANAAWADATQLSGNMLAGPRPIFDCAFWEKASYLHPVGISWPPAFLDGLSALARQSRLPVPLQPVGPVALCSLGTSPHAAADASLWACLGYWHLERHEFQKALTALKRAESSSQSPDAAAWLRLGQAQALSSVGQTQAATATLLQQVAQNDHAPVTRAAMAELGALKVHAGATQQGVSLLRQALETNPRVDWPGRPHAEADLGLALLLSGDERGGLAWLHQARGSFEARGDMQSVSQTLWNEARYCEQIKNKERMAALDQQHKSLQF